MSDVFRGKYFRIETKKRGKCAPRRELCLQDTSTRGFSGKLCLVVLSEGGCCPQEQTLTLGANFVPQRKLCPEGKLCP